MHTSQEQNVSLIINWMKSCARCSRRLYMVENHGPLYMKHPRSHYKSNGIAKENEGKITRQVLFLFQWDTVLSDEITCDVVPMDACHLLLELPPSLPPIRGIEHQIDLVPGSILPNKAAYRCSPHEAKELQKQVGSIEVRIFSKKDINKENQTKQARNGKSAEIKADGVILQMGQPELVY
ncbi:hypothetical protein Tco_0920160 [Tanacetum coccineum]